MAAVPSRQPRALRHALCILVGTLGFAVGCLPKKVSSNRKSQPGDVGSQELGPVPNSDDTQVCRELQSAMLGKISQLLDIQACKEDKDCSSFTLKSCLFESCPLPVLGANRDKVEKDFADFAAGVCEKNPDAKEKCGFSKPSCGDSKVACVDGKCFYDIPMLKGYTVFQRFVSCAVPDSKAACPEGENKTQLEFAKKCSDGGFSAQDCGCQAYLCTGKVSIDVVGFDIKGRKTSCVPSYGSMVDVGPEKGFQEACVAAGSTAKACLDGRVVCEKKIDFSPPTCEIKADDQKICGVTVRESCSTSELPCRPEVIVDHASDCERAREGAVALFRGACCPGYTGRACALVGKGSDAKPEPVESVCEIVTRQKDTSGAGGTGDSISFNHIGSCQ